MNTGYVLPPEIYNMCKAFAEKVVDTNLDEYASRKQFDKQKIISDILIGKLAEWGVYFIYLEDNRRLDPPDMKVYTADKKSYDADLRYGNYKLHIKSQTVESVRRYGHSWLFQTKDPLFVHSDEYDIIIGCTVCVYQDMCVRVELEIEKTFSAIKFEKPKLAKFYGNKKAFYLKDNL